MQVTVRPATLADVDGICGVFDEATKQHPDLPQLEHPLVERWTAEMISHNLSWVAVDERGSIVGALTAIWRPIPRAPSVVVIAVLHFYVARRARQSRAARLLLASLKAASDSTGVAAALSTTYGSSPEVVDRLMARSGFEQVGGNIVCSAE